MRLLFIVNTGSGSAATHWPVMITEYFQSLNHVVELYHLPQNFNLQTINQKIRLFSPDRVIAVGGDGTVKSVVTCLLGKKISVGILPAGSANGMAKELGIPDDPIKALDVIVHGALKKIHLTRINDEYCIHLSDIGLNAYAMKKFEKLHSRGMWGYLKASLQAIWKSPLMHVKMEVDKKLLYRKAAIIVIANGTRYGTGAVVNPIGSLEEEFFEIIVVKKISVKEVFKMMFSHTPYDPEKTEIFRANSLVIHPARKVHFQIDGEYCGLVKGITALLVPQAIEMILPDEED